MKKQSPEHVAKRVASRLSRSGSAMVPCAVCGTHRRRPKSQVGLLKTCSKKCGYLYKRMTGSVQRENHPYWKGGAFIDKDGYKMIRVGGEKKYKREHHLVIERRLGRDLKSGEVVHHWDEVRLNNEKENLAYLRHQAAHLRLHRFAQRHEIPVAELKFSQEWLKD